MIPEQSPVAAPPHRSVVFGVDFSGAADAGRRIWITRASVDLDGPRPSLRIAGCFRGATLPGSGVGREACLPALRGFIAAQHDALFGLDFPFSLPAALVTPLDWNALAVDLSRRHADAAAFRAACQRATCGRELRRACDAEARTPFSPYNLRLYRQTWHGIADLLGPLVREGCVAVLPLQPPAAGKPWLMEICPASLLKSLGLYRPYKGRTRRERLARGHILSAIESSAGLSWSSATARRRVLADAGGDALDSLLAAIAVARTLRAAQRDPDVFLPRSPQESLEGRVYF